MKRLSIFALTFLISTHTFGQTGFDCGMPGEDSVLTSTERCIVQCIKDLRLEQYLGHENVAFFDSIVNCSVKKLKLWSYRNDNYYTAIIFQLTDNLEMRLYPKQLIYSHKKMYDAKKKFDPQLAQLEIPFKITLVKGFDFLCEMGSLPGLPDNN